MAAPNRARQSMSFGQIAERAFSNRHVPVIRARELQELADYPIKASKPILTKEALTYCHTRYRAFETDYNNRVEQANKEIDAYNAKVEDYWRQSGKFDFWQDHNTKFEQARLKRAPKKQEARFRSTWSYNDHVREKNAEFLDHPVIKLIRIHPLKEAHRAFFSALLWTYQNQLKQAARDKENKGSPFYHRTVARVDVNLQHMLNLKHKNGHPMLLKRKGAYNDIKKRLEEADVLQARGNRGHKRGVLYLIHPAIFAVQDDLTGKLTTLENQSLTEEGTRKSWDIETLTGSSNEPLVKGNVDKSPFPIRKKVARAGEASSGPGEDFLPDISFASQKSTGTPSGKVRNPGADPKKNPGSSTPEFPEVGPARGTPSRKEGGATKPEDDHPSPKCGMPAEAAPTPGTEGTAGHRSTAEPTSFKDDAGRLPGSTRKNPDIRSHSDPASSISGATPGIREVTRWEANSLELQQMMQFPEELAQGLSNNSYKNAEPIPYHLLKMEAERGILDREDFRELLLQDLFKQFSKLYTDHPYFEKIYKREWLKTYQLWLHSSALMNPNGHDLHKSTALQTYLKVLYVILDKRWGVLRPIQKKKFTPANPAIYLNPKNSTKGTFRYAFKHASENSEKVRKGIRRMLKIQKEAAEKALEYEKYLPNLTRVMARYKNGRITERDLLDYVHFEMPRAIQLNFHKHWENFIINHKSK